MLFVGDGVNDGAALACADIGIALSAGAASTVLVADGVIAARPGWSIRSYRRRADALSSGIVIWASPRIEHRVRKEEAQ